MKKTEGHIEEQTEQSNDFETINTVTDTVADTATSSDIVVESPDQDNTPSITLSKPSKPSKPINQKKRRFFITLTKIFCTITIFIFAGILITNRILPAHGLYFNTNNSAMSMYPTLRSGALLLCAQDSAAPFEELKVGDIVVCMRRMSKTKMEFIVTDDGVIGSYTIDLAAPDKDDRNAYYTEDKDAVYDPNKSYVHRIIQINEVGDRVIFTQGDNNPGEDYKAVFKGGYIAKVIWYMNGAGPIFGFLFESVFGLLIFYIMTCILIFYTVFLMPERLLDKAS